MILPSRLQAGSDLPAILAPMYRVSGPELIIAACRAGMISAFPTQTPASTAELAGWIDAIGAGLAGRDHAPWGVSMIAHSSYRRFEEELDLVLAAQPAFVVTALGSPRRALEPVHRAGGLVFADVASVALARKAVDAGADGLILLCGGAGGNTGHANPFAFVEEVRGFFDGVIVLAGAIGTGRAIRAAEIMGADFAYVGTRFIAARESMASAEYKDAVIRARLDDIVTTAAVSGVPATFVRASLIDAGFDPEGLARIDFQRAFDGAPPPRAYAAGHGVGATRADSDTATIVAALRAEYRLTCGRS